MASDFRYVSAARGYAPQHIGGIANSAQPGDRPELVKAGGLGYAGPSWPGRRCKKKSNFP